MIPMPDKKTEAYVEVIEAIKLIVKPLGMDSLIAPYFPLAVLNDFEQSIMNAFRHCFPAIAIKGYYFHLKHANQGWL